MLHRLALAALLPYSCLHLNFFELFIIYAATWYLTLSLHRDPRILNRAFERFISSHMAIFTTISAGLRLFLAYIMCLVPIWNCLFRDVSAEYRTRMKTRRDTRPGKMTSVAPWVFGASIAVCIGMRDGMLDTRGMAVWWIVDVIFFWLSIVDVAQDVVHAARWYLGGWKDAVKDEAAKGKKLGAVVSVRVQDHILEMMEEMKDVEAAAVRELSGKVKL
jgi:hypothetical protein